MNKLDRRVMFSVFIFVIGISFVYVNAFIGLGLMLLSAMMLLKALDTQEKEEKKV